MQGERLTKAGIGVCGGGEAAGGEAGRGLGGSCWPGLGSWDPFQVPLREHNGFALQLRL